MPHVRAVGVRHGIDRTEMDLRVRPGDDFDEFAAGSWRRRAIIPSDKEEIGTISDASDRVNLQLRLILERDSLRPETRDAHLVGDLYRAMMNVPGIEAEGEMELRAQLRGVRKIRSRAELARLMGASHARFGASLFDADVWVDLKRPDRNAVRLFQGGLGLGYPEAYTAADSRSRLTAYRDYVARTLRMIGWSDSSVLAEQIVRLETAVATGSWSTAASRDRSKRYNPMTVSDLKAYATEFPWEEFVGGMGLPLDQVLIVQQKSAFPKIAAIFGETPLPVLKAWEAFRLTDQLAPFLPRRYVGNRFKFRGRIEQGLKSQPPRWAQAVDAVNMLLPDAVGREYVRARFPPEAKREVERMSGLFRTAMAHRIMAATWMADATKRTGIEKLGRVRFMIGYPASSRHYPGLALDRHDVVQSVSRTRAYNWNADLRSMNRPVDRETWAIPPQSVDAFSDQSRVALGITAAMLQPPLFDPSADPAANFGAIGEALGHELTHQFDDQGRKYDSTGALRDWWTASDGQSFEAAAARLAKQFSEIEVAPEIHLNGEQTLSENIADLGGLLLALDAYHLSLGGKPAPVIDGLTGDQRLFLAWARVFRTKERPQSIASQALGGTHTPFKFRVIGPMRNIDAWYEVFHVVPGDRYYLAPADRVKIW